MVVMKNRSAQIAQRYLPTRLGANAREPARAMESAFVCMVDLRDQDRAARTTRPRSGGAGPARASRDAAPDDGSRHFRFPLTTSPHRNPRHGATFSAFTLERAGIAAGRADGGSP